MLSAKLLIEQRTNFLLVALLKCQMLVSQAFHLTHLIVMFKLVAQQTNPIYKS